MKKYDLHKDGITQSLLAQYKMCPRKFKFETDGLCGGGSLAREFGSFFHYLLEQCYKNQCVNIQKEIDKYEFDKTVSTEDAEYCRAYAGVMVPFYMTLYKKEFAGALGTCSPEIQLDTEFADFRIRGKIDCAFDKKGKVTLLETKTKGQIPEDKILNFLPIDWQTLFYDNGYTCQFNKQPEKIIYNVIRFSKKSMKEGIVAFQEKLLSEVKKNPSYFFMRWETTYSQKDRDLFQMELQATLCQVEQSFVDDYFPRNLCACMAPYACSFIGLCATGEKTGLLKKSSHFPELEN